MGGQFSQEDPVRCRHYARFTAHLDRIHFDALYWTFFFLVIMALFTASWMFQWTMKYRDCATFTVDRFRKRLKVSLICTLGIFAVSAVVLVMEVYALLALQFCDGEDLMSLYWATWTMLQLGSEIAILGVSLALWHHLWDMEQPLWALALGTPVLVVAGFGHLLSLVCRRFYHKAKGRTKAPCFSCSDEGCVDGRDVPSRTSDETQLQPQPQQQEGEEEEEEKGEEEEGEKRVDQPLDLSTNAFYIAMDTGDDERVRRWPCFVSMADGKAVVRVTAVAAPPPPPPPPPLMTTSPRPPSG